MCGIVGYVGSESCKNILFNGLKTLEYRGYDSAGIATLGNEKITLVKSEGKLSNLEPLLKNLPEKNTLGIGHTRWATHGAAITQNAHPHMVDELAIVHNGIIENYKDLKAGLEAAGTEFSTETDTEVVLHLLHQDLLDSEPSRRLKILQDFVLKLKGAFSLGILCRDEPDKIYLIKQGSPLVIGIGDDKMLFASDAAALIEHTQKAIYLEDGQMAVLTSSSLELLSFEGEVIEPEIQELNWKADSLGKDGYAHYMLKEIHEQPSLMRNHIERVLLNSNESTFGLDKLDLERVKVVHLIACGTAYLSGVVWKYDLERQTNLTVNVELASEFRYRDPALGSDSLVVAISQSGETMDTLQSIKYARRRGAQTYSLCNVAFSSITRECDSGYLMEAGPEIGVASTKAFTSMVLSAYFITRSFSSIRLKQGLLNDIDTKNIRLIPSAVESILNFIPQIEKVAKEYFESSSFLFIGRGEHYPIALEGALKLKEISYIHAEGYAAGELKHGPIALIDHNMPVVALAPKDFFYEKTLSNIEQVKARHGKVIGVGEQGDETLRRLCDHVIEVPKSEDRILQSLLSVVPLQIFSYYTALLRGTDVDQPRNLAKSVTVE